MTKELELPLYQEGKSGIVWALKEVKEGCIFKEFVAYFIKSAADPETYITPAIYEVGKWIVSQAFKQAFIVIPERLKNRSKDKKESEDIKNIIKNSPNVVEFEMYKKLMEESKGKKH